MIAAGDAVRSWARARSVIRSSRTSAGTSSEVVGEQAVAAVAYKEVGAVRTRLVGGREVRVPPLRVSQREEIPGQVRDAQITLQRQGCYGVEGGRRSLVGLPVDDEPGLSDGLAGSRRALPRCKVPGRASARISREILGRCSGQVQYGDNAAN